MLLKAYIVLDLIPSIIYLLLINFIFSDEVNKWVIILSIVFYLIIAIITNKIVHNIKEKKSNANYGAYGAGMTVFMGSLAYISTQVLGAYTLSLILALITAFVFYFLYYYLKYLIDNNIDYVDIKGK